jgi:hypothetical protein
LRPLAILAVSATVALTAFTKLILISQARRNCLQSCATAIVGKPAPETIIKQNINLGIDCGSDDYPRLRSSSDALSASVPVFAMGSCISLRNSILIAKRCNHSEGGCSRHRYEDGGVSAKPASEQ